MKILWTLLITLYVQTSSAFCDPDTLWTRMYGGPDSFDVGFCVRVTDDGGFIVTGDREAHLDFPIYPQTDIFLIKTDAQGDTQWTKTYGITGYTAEFGRSVELTNDGGFIICGIQNTNIYLIKTDSSGDTIWTRDYTNEFAEGGTAWEVHQTEDGGFVVAGDIVTETGGWDWCLLKTDAQGDTQWLRAYIDTSYINIGERAYSVKSTADGGYVACGEGGAHLIKTDSLGNLLGWRLYADPEDARFRSVVVCRSGGYALTGVMEDQYGDRLCLLKTDDNGDMQWKKLYGVMYPGFSEGYSLEETTDGGYIIAGITGDYLFPDMYIVKTDSQGNALWKRTYAGYGTEEGWSVRQIDGDSLGANDFIVTGVWTGPDADNDVWLLRIGEITSVEDDGDPGLNPGPLPESFGNLEIYPNPTNAIAKISYTVPQGFPQQAVGHPGEVILTIYNLLGQRMYEQTVMHQKPGRYSTSWDGSRYPSGIYLVRVKMGEMEETKRLLILK